MNSKKDIEKVIQYIDESGQELTISLDNIVPFSLEALEKTKGCQNKLFPLIISGKEIINGKSNINSNELTFTANIDFHKKPKVFCLVDNGWLPPALGANFSFIVDRNIVSILKQHSENSTRFDHESTHWWLQFDSNILINPMLYAMEGNKQRTPSFQEFRQQFDEASEIINTSLPKSSLITYSDIHYAAAYEQLTMLDEKNKVEAIFLEKISKSIVNRITDENIDYIKSEIITIADSLSLKRQSLVILLALACVYEKKDGSGLLIGRKIIKPSENYTKQNAYNAIADLRAMEIFIAGKCFNLKPSSSLMTCDIALAGFWCSLNPRNFTMLDNKAKFDFSLNSNLFPRLSNDEAVKLTAELNEI